MNVYSKKHWYFRLTVVGLLAVLWSCSKNDGPAIIPDPVLPQRTILYYLGTDNNLYIEADEKVEALRLGFPGGNNRLVIYKDKLNTPPELLEIYADEKAGENLIRTVKTYTDQNSASGETFQLVLRDVEQLFPAASYGLILFSHATGWLPPGALIRPEARLKQMGIPPIRTYTVAMDGYDELGLTAFAAAIPHGFFDFIAFEACFMAGIEVLYELKDKTDFIVSSSAEIVSPGFLPVYEESLHLLYEPRADLAGFAEAYFNFWDSQRGDYRSATITVANTARLPRLADWVKQYAAHNVTAGDLSDIQHFDRYPDHRLFFDFADYYQRKAETDAAAQLDELLKSIVTYRAATPEFILGQQGFQINRHSGITTYIAQARFAKLNTAYRALAWYKDTH